MLRGGKFNTHIYCSRRSGYAILRSRFSSLDSSVALLLIFKLKIIILRTQFSAICQNIVYCSTPEPASRQLPSLPPVGSQQSPVYSAQFSQSSVFSLRPATHKGPSSGSAAAHFKLIEIFQRFSPLPMLPVVSSACSSLAMYPSRCSCGADQSEDFFLLFCILHIAFNRIQCSFLSHAIYLLRI